MSSKLEIMVRNLKELEKRVAMYGPGQAPLFLLNQIEDLRVEIRQQSEGELAHLAPTDMEPGEASPFIMQLFQPSGGSPQVQVLRSWAGETSPQPVALPYAPDQLPLVLKALAAPAGPAPAARFSPEDVSQLQALGLVEAGYLLDKMYETVGHSLYRALFPGPVHERFQASRARAKEERRSLALRLVFEAGAATLAAYPWELIDDDLPLVADGVADLTRYIAFPGPQTRLAVELPLRVLVISARPAGLPTLPAQAEPEAIAAGLQPLVEQGLLEVGTLSFPTREALIDRLRAEAIQLIHFDGHGSFGRLCPSCHILYTPGSNRCTRCGYPLSTVTPQGYLAFEDGAGQASYTSARAFANALARSQVRLVMLSACQSGQVGGEGVFSGVGPALIQAGVPAVVAMQLAVPVEQAVRFARAFYAALAGFRPLVEAVGHGRQQLYGARSDRQAWFVPTLYLRSEDPRGVLFRPANGGD